MAAVNKSYRQGQILKLIRTKSILTQDELAQELKQGAGIDTTQVTLSRDIRELGLLKTSGGYRQLAPAAAGPEAATVVAELMHDLRVAQNLVVLRTSPGNANALAAALDREEWPDIVGTIAGDDTVLVIAPDNATAGKVRNKLLGFQRTR